MTLLERRRAMMGRKAEEEWDYILTTKDSYGGLRQQAINVHAGQKIIIAWQNRASRLTRRLWGLEAGATLVETNATNLPSNEIPVSGRYTYTVKTDGTFIAAGLQTGSGRSAYYLMADWVKVRIIG